MKTFKLIITVLIIVGWTSCKKGNSIVSDAPSSPFPSAEFIKGADVSWITEMETAGRKFYSGSGLLQDGLIILKNAGINTVRLRVWVNPTGGWNNAADVLAKALRAKQLGMRIMIDFHYSDTWADPGNQTKPAAWSGQNIDALQVSVSKHTTDIMTMLKENSVLPEWVQVGNETNDGMLWPEGKASLNMGNFAKLVNAGYNAVKAVSPYTKVMVHVSNGNDNALFRWLFDGLRMNGAKWDVIGMSLYPDPTNWSLQNAKCLINMNDMAERYDKDIMVAEVGMSWDSAVECKNFLADLIAKTKSVTGNKGLGVLYWEPEAYNNWQGYTKGALDNSGRPTVALEAFH